MRDAAGLSANSMEGRLVESLSFFGEIERETDLEVFLADRSWSVPISDSSGTRTEDLAVEDIVGASRRDRMASECVVPRGRAPRPLYGRML